MCWEHHSLFLSLCWMRIIAFCLSAFSLRKTTFFLFSILVDMVTSLFIKYNYWWISKSPSNVPEGKKIWAATWQNQQSDYALNEDSDQPVHPPSLIRVFAVRCMVAKDPSFLHADSTVTLLVLSCRGSYLFISSFLIKTCVYFKVGRSKKAKWYSEYSV